MATEWNEERKIQLQEVVYITQFQVDIEASIILGEEFRERQAEFIKAAKLLANMAATPPSNLDVNAFNENMANALYRLVRFRYIRKTRDELISSGQYNQFGNVALRKLIDQIVELQDNKQTQSENSYVYTQDIIDPWLTNNYDMWRLHSILRDDTKQRDDIPKAIGDIDITAILADRTFRNILAYRLLFLSGEIRRYDKIAKDYKLLQEMLAVRLKELEE